MDIGILRKRFTLEKPVRTSDGKGGFSTAWTTVSRPWGSLGHLSSSEAVDSGGLRPTSTFEIRMRYRKGVTSEMRLTLGTRTFRIESVENLEERNRELILQAAEEKS